MNDFIFMCIGMGIPFVGGIVFLIIYIALKGELNKHGKKQCLISAIALIMGFLVLAGATFNYFSQCPNPKCNEWVKSAYCQKCGWEVNSTIDCPTCEKKFNADKIPAFCPDCGTEVPSD